MKKTLLSALALFVGYSVQAQTHFSDDFNDGDLNGWTSIDNDSDPATTAPNYDEWYNGDFSSYFSNLGAGSAVSRSWAANVAYSPDNILVSSAINLTAAPASGLSLLFNIGTLEASPYHAEHYAVYVTTGNSLSDITAATPVHETTLATPSAMGAVTVDLSAYAGQTVYISFRHYNCTDMNTLILDDVAVKNLQPDDAALNAVSLARYAQMGSNNTMQFAVENKGGNTITSLDIDWNDGASHSATIPVNIAAGATATVSHPTAVSYASVVEKNIVVAITSVNGNTDPDLSNNGGTAKINTVSAVVPKAVVIEEGTGTWCGWCPRGAVAMDYMYDTYGAGGQFVGIAVHNNDPMTVAAYNSGAGISGFPGCNVDRALLGESVSQGLFEGFYNDRKDMVVPASVTGTFSVTGNVVTVNASATFKTTFAAADYRLAVVITEDGVTGTGSGYDQVNYYAGGTNGAMGGYEALPNPVPAAQMVYDHVGRALLGGYDGQAASVPAAISDGTTANYTFNYTVPAGQVRSKMHAVVLLIDNSNGEIVNAKSMRLTSAGLDENQANIAMEVFPNPATDVVKVSFDAEGQDYAVTVYNLQGQVVRNIEVKQANGTQEVSVPVSDLASGNYLVSVSTNGVSHTKQITVK
ncbi:MAG: choice-of-anchor J domain-containing protein [Crocinitomicaceae bacterium]|jgi:hypothetical protein|nr:choice-of-anchor J domain-containing protein [Crocinitomicaceae bacterium]